MKIRELTESEVEFRVLAEVDDSSVRGNAMASGDEAFDRSVEEKILERLKQGDVWAWASVTVEARWRDWVGRDYLGACSYGSEEDFTGDDYYVDMKAEALRRLNEEVQAAAEELEELAC